MKLLALLRDALSRVVAIREALEDGDPAYAHALADDLEHDIAGGLATIGEWPRCPDCGGRAPTVELLERHRARRCCGPIGASLRRLRPARR